MMGTIKHAGQDWGCGWGERQQPIIRYFSPLSIRLQNPPFTFQPDPPESLSKLKQIPLNI